MARWAKIYRVTKGKGYNLVKVLNNPNKGACWKQNKEQANRIQHIFSYADSKRRTIKNIRLGQGLNHGFESMISILI